MFLLQLFQQLPARAQGFGIKPFPQVVRDLPERIGPATDPFRPGLRPGRWPNLPVLPGRAQRGREGIQRGLLRSGPRPDAVRGIGDLLLPASHPLQETDRIQPLLKLADRIPHGLGGAGVIEQLQARCCRTAEPFFRSANA